MDSWRLTQIKDKISLEKTKKNILKAYIIGKNTNFLETNSQNSKI